MTITEKDALAYKANGKYHADLKRRGLYCLAKTNKAPQPIITILKKKYRSWYEKELEKLKSKEFRVREYPAINKGA